MASPRLILVPQYPAALRYQEWWYWYFKDQYAEYFDEVIQLGPSVVAEKSNRKDFSTADKAIRFECEQIRQYMQLEIRASDILLLHDLSFPGLFANVLFHKRPARCFAICHATAANRYDLFQPIRHVKYPVERSVARLFNGVFVASEYHKKKLGWPDLHVFPFPLPPLQSLYANLGLTDTTKDVTFISVARPSRQKVNRTLESNYEFAMKHGKIWRPKPKTWEEYFTALKRSKFLIVTAREETYGYQVIDAVLQGCIPICPKGLCYGELLSPTYLYRPDDVNNMANTTIRLMQTMKVPDVPWKGDEFFEATASIMLDQ